MSKMKKLPIFLSRYLRSTTNITTTTTRYYSNTKFHLVPSKLESLEQYYAEKKAAKQRRLEQYLKKQERQSKLATRRDETKKNYWKKQYRTWFDTYSSKQSYLDREARRKGMSWKIKVAAMIERLPVVTPDKPDWELDYLNLSAELSKYDSIKYPDELGMANPMDQEILTEEELYALLPEGLVPSPRVTDADTSGNIQTLNRKLKTRVYLSIKPTDEEGWTFPTRTLDIDNQETFLEGAKNATKSVVGEDLILRCLSNCPMGIDLTAYSNEERETNNNNNNNNNNGNDDDQYFGEKVFYMRVQYEDGDVDSTLMDETMNDWGWLDRDEMEERVALERGEMTGKFFKYML